MGQVQNFVDEGVDWKGLGVVDIEDEHFADEPQNTSRELVAVEAEKPSIAYIPPTEVPDLDEMNEGMNIAPEYWEVENKGDTKRGVLIGWSVLNGQNGPVPLAVLQNKAGIWTCAGTNLVQQLRNISIGTPLQATYEGKEKTSKGNMVKKFTIKLLNPKPALPDMNLQAGGVKIKSKQTA
jgi:hypothetical protein